MHRNRVGNDISGGLSLLPAELFLHRRLSYIPRSPILGTLPTEYIGQKFGSPVLFPLTYETLLKVQMILGERQPEEVFEAATQRRQALSSLRCWGGQ